MESFFISILHNNVLITHKDRLHAGEGEEDGDKSYENLCGVVGLEELLLGERRNEFPLFHTFCRCNLNGLCRRGLIGGLSFIKFSSSIFSAQKAITKTKFYICYFTYKIVLYANKINFKLNTITSLFVLL